MKEPGINPLTVQLEDDPLHHLTLATFWNNIKGEHEVKRALLLGLLLLLCFALWFSRHAVLYFRMTQNICTVTTYLQMALQEHKWINISHNKWGYGNTSLVPPFSLFEDRLDLSKTDKQTQAQSLPRHERLWHIWRVRSHCDTLSKHKCFDITVSSYRKTVWPLTRNENDEIKMKKKYRWLVWLWWSKNIATTCKDKRSHEYLDLLLLWAACNMQCLVLLLKITWLFCSGWVRPNLRWEWCETTNLWQGQKFPPHYMWIEALNL